MQFHKILTSASFDPILKFELQNASGMRVSKPASCHEIAILRFEKKRFRPHSHSQHPHPASHQLCLVTTTKRSPAASTAPQSPLSHRHSRSYFLGTLLQQRDHQPFCILQHRSGSTLGVSVTTTSNQSAGFPLNPALFPVRDWSSPKDSAVASPSKQTHQEETALPELRTDSRSQHTTSLQRNQ